MIPRYFKQFLAVALMLMAAVVAPQSLYAQCVTPPSDMVAWWPLDETAGTTSEDIAGSFDNFGTWMNNPVSVTGMVADALSFDGSNYVAVPNHPELDFGEGDLTIDAWIYPTNLSGVIPIVDKREDNVQAHGYTLFLLDGKLYFHLAVDSRPSSSCGNTTNNACQNYSSGVNITINTWTHVAVTVDRDQPAGGLFYVNGVNVASFDPLTQAGSISNAGDLWIGRRHPVDVASASKYFYGRIDEVELFNRVLGPSEVYSIWSANDLGKCKCVTPPSDMGAWWPLDETAGSTSKDIAGSFNNLGTWKNSPAPVAGMVGGALSFDGSNSVDVPNQDELNFGTGDFSIDLWIKTTDASGTRTIMDKRTGSLPNVTGYSLYLWNGKPGLGLFDGAGYTNWNSTGFVANGNWHHVAVTVDRDNTSGLLFYVDGSLVSTFDPKGRPGTLTNTAPFVMARNLISPSYTLAGTLDEIELFNRVLSPSEVYSIWKADGFGKCKCYATGDADGNGMTLTVADLVYLTAFVTGGGPAPVPLYTCDLNGDCVIDAIDVQVYQNYFTNGISAFDPYGGYPVPACCNPTVDIVILGACCLPDGSCVPNLTKGVCDEMSGGPDNWHPNISCTPNPCDTCIKVPADLIAWWPLDETEPKTAWDIAGLYNAAHEQYPTGGPGFAAGKVNGAYRFDWSINYHGIVRSFKDPFDNIGSGDFTIDAWIYPEELGSWCLGLPGPSNNFFSPCEDRTIVDNRVTGIAPGIRFFVRNSTSGATDCKVLPGRLVLQMNGTDFVSSTTPVELGSLASWQHVAVTVSRPAGGPLVGTFYYNGVPDPVTFAPKQGALTFSHMIDLGHGTTTTSTGCPYITTFFSGLLDEVQIFKRALEPYEIANIFNADKWGKCKDHCSLPYVVRMDNGQLTATAALTIYNGSSQSHDYTWSAQGMPIDLPALNTDGTSMSFTYNPAPPVPIPSLGHQDIIVTMTRPFPYPTFGLGDFAGFEVLSSRTDPGSATFTCRSAVYGTGKWIVNRIGDEFTAPTPMYPHDVDSIDFSVMNEADSSGGLFKYEIRAVSGCQCDTSDDEIVVSLNGLPAGTSIIDSVTVPLGDSVVITVNAELLEYKPFNFQNIVLLADWDKDGELEPAAATTIHPITFQDCNSNDQDDSLDIALGTSLDANGNGFPDECEAGAEECPYCYTALGEATVTCDLDDSTITVSDIGSSGDNGIALDCGGAPSIHPAWQSFDPEGTLPAGAFLTVTAIGDVDSTSDRIISIGQAEKLPSGWWQISVDHSSIGATSHTIMVYRNNLLVATVTGQTGSAVAVTSLDPTDWETDDKGQTTPTWNYLVPAEITILSVRARGPLTVVGDRLCIIPENATADIQALSYTNITAANIGSITITGIAFGSPFLCGDANHDDAVDISDVVFLIAYIFAGGSAPSPLLAGDANNDGSVDISDVVYLIAYIFGGGSAPCSGSYSKLSPEDSEPPAGSRSFQSATLKLTENEATNSSAKTSAVEMHTDIEVAGVQLEFKTDVSKADEIVAQTTERSKNLQLFSGVVDGLFKVGLIDMTGKNAITAGDGPIANFDFKGDRKNLELVNGIVCDRAGKRLNVKIVQTGKASALPKQYSLSQNYPNPFNPSTEIRFALPKSCEVRVEVLNVLGQTIRTLASGLQTAGIHFVTWDGTDEKGNSVSSGVYFYRVVSDEFTTSRKMLLLK
jgi:hypothetical protein